MKVNEKNRLTHKTPDFSTTKRLHCDDKNENEDKLAVKWH